MTLVRFICVSVAVHLSSHTKIMKIFAHPSTEAIQSFNTESLYQA